MLDKLEGSDFTPRSDWIDATRGLGIILVFYGHVLQKAFLPSNEAVGDQFRLIYSFHVPLFFVLSGVVFKPRRDVSARIVEIASRRLLPFLFFGALLAPLWLWDEHLARAPIARDTVHVVLDYLLAGLS